MVYTFIGIVMVVVVLLEVITGQKFSVFEISLIKINYN
jgi:hypothetical protein